MATFIQTKSGVNWCTDLSIAEVRLAINENEQITIWWYSVAGQRYKEKVWLNEDDLSYIRTESDDG